MTRQQVKTEQHVVRLEAIALAIDFLDLLEGDCDLEPETDRCIAGDDNLTVKVRQLGESGDSGMDDCDHEDSDGKEADSDH
jgi:hypothetical protein